MASAQSAPIPRDYPRFASRIPVQVQVVHAWEGSTRASVGATLFNVSRGGAGVSLPYVVPPRTRLAVLVPVAAPGLRIPAEVVWTSHAPGHGGGTAVYGVRWMIYLSRESLEAWFPEGGSGPDGRAAGICLSPPVDLATVTGHVAIVQQEAGPGSGDQNPLRQPQGPI